jgi:hypothetical protein
MQDPTMFAVYGVVSIALFWSLVNGVSMGSMVGADGQVSADEGGEGLTFSYVLRVLALIFCLVGAGHALGIVDAPLDLLQRMISAV